MFGPPRKHYDRNYAAWSDGHCPACAEADGVVVWVRRERDASDHEDYWHLLESIAARITRGDQ